MKDGEPCTSRGVSTVLEGVTPRPLTKGSMAWRFLPYELYTVMRYLQYSTLQQKNLTHFDSGTGRCNWSEVLMSATSLNIFISSGRLKNFANRVLAR